MEESANPKREEARMEHDVPPVAGDIEQPSVQHHGTVGESSELQNTSKFDKSSGSQSIGSANLFIEPARKENRQSSFDQSMDRDFRGAQSVEPNSIEATDPGRKAGPRILDLENVPLDERSRIKSERLCWAIFGSVVISLGIGTILVVTYQEEIAGIIARKQTAPVELYFILFFLNYLGTQPMFPGTTTIYILAGFLLDYWGFPILYVSSVLGGWSTFLLSKLLVKHGYLSWVVVYYRFQSYQNYIRAVERAVSEKSYKAAVLLQLSGSPYGLLNLILALTEITFKDFVFATLVSRLKLISYVSLGAGLKSAVSLKFNPNQYKDDQKYIWISVSTFVLTSVALTYVLYYARQQLLGMRPRPPTVISVLDTQANDSTTPRSS